MKAFNLRKYGYKMAMGMQLAVVLIMSILFVVNQPVIAIAGAAHSQAGMGQQDTYIGSYLSALNTLHKTNNVSSSQEAVSKSSELTPAAGSCDLTVTYSGSYLLALNTLHKTNNTSSSEAAVSKSSELAPAARSCDVTATHPSYIDYRSGY